MSEYWMVYLFDFDIYQNSLVALKRSGKVNLLVNENIDVQMGYMNIYYLNL